MLITFVQVQTDQMNCLLYQRLNYDLKSLLEKRCNISIKCLKIDSSTKEVSKLMARQRGTEKQTLKNVEDS